MRAAAPMEAEPGAKPPLFARLLTRHACACTVLWLAIPAALAVVVAPHIKLAGPLEGWRIRDHPTADALDALVLASLDAGLHDSDAAQAVPPAAPPAPPWWPQLPPPVLLPQCRRMSTMTLIFSGRDGQSMLTASRLREVARLERACVEALRDVCLLVDVAGERVCQPAHSLSRFLPPEAEVRSCVANRTSAAAGGGDASSAAVDACTVGEAIARAGRGEAIEPTSKCADVPCDWTERWSCEDSPERGTEGYVTPDGTLGYRCCCELPAERRANARAVHAALDILSAAATAAASSAAIRHLGSPHSLSAAMPFLDDLALAVPSADAQADGEGEDTGSISGHFDNLNLGGLAATAAASPGVAGVAGFSAAGLAALAAALAAVDSLVSGSGSATAMFNVSALDDAARLLNATSAQLLALQQLAQGLSPPGTPLGTMQLPASLPASLPTSLPADVGSWLEAVASTVELPSRLTPDAMLGALLPLFGGGLAAGVPDLSSLPPPPSSLLNLSSLSALRPTLVNLSSVPGAAALLPWLDGIDLDEWDGQGGLGGLLSGRNASAAALEMLRGLIDRGYGEIDLAEVRQLVMVRTNLTEANLDALGQAWAAGSAVARTTPQLTKRLVALSVDQLASQARIGPVDGVPPQLTEPLAALNSSDVDVLVEALGALLDLARLSSAPSSPRVTDPTEFISRDFAARPNGGLGLAFSASALRSHIALGYPMRGFNSTAHTEEQATAMRHAIYPAFERFVASENARGGDVILAWDVSGGWTFWLGKLILQSDLMFALGSLALVCAFITAHSRSLLLGLIGIVQIVASFPIALFIYRVVLGIELFGAMHIIGIYVILGIGCDDLFVLLDSWNQVWMAPPLAQASTEARLWWAYRRAISAMSVTTLTDICAFLSSLLCIIPNLASFAIFTALLAAANFFLSCTLWPSALVLHERKKATRLLTCRCAVACPSSRASLATLDAAAAPAPSPSTPSSKRDADRDVSDAWQDITSPSPAGGAPPSPGVASSFGRASTDRPAAPTSAAMPAASRRVERFYAETYVPFLTRGRNAAVLLVLCAVVTVAAGAFAARLKPASRDINVWPRRSNPFRYTELRDTRFELARESLHLLWGVASVDRTGVRRFVESDLGQVRYDDAFDAADPATQVALLAGCREPPLQPQLQVLPGSARCVIGAFHDWLLDQASSGEPVSSGNASWPLPREAFGTRLLEFVSANPHWGAHLSATRASGGSLRLRHVVATFTIQVERNQPAFALRPLYDAWETEVARLTAQAPASAGRPIQTAGALWVQMSVQLLLIIYARGVVLASLCVAFVILLLCYRSVRLAALCVLTISSVVVTWAGTMVAFFDMQVGMIESLVLMVSVGLMLDPLTHLAHAFACARGSRPERLASAMTTIGISILAGALSTAGSCAMLFLCTLTLFTQFGTLLCSLLAVTLLLCNLFLAPLLLHFGPVDAAAGSSFALCPKRRLFYRLGHGVALALATPTAPRGVDDGARLSVVKLQEEV